MKFKHQDMKVKFLNPNEVSRLFEDWGEFAETCYSDNPDEEKSLEDKKRIGQGCFITKHNSGSRTTYFKFRVLNTPRFMVDQLVRHEVGVVKNVQSFRYVGKDSFAYEVPSEILDNKELCKRYDQHMQETMQLYSDIQTYIIGKGKSKERANEQARYILPMATHSALTIGFTYEALVHFCNERLCNRAEDIIHKLAIMIRDEVLKVLPQLKNKLVPKCEDLLYCPEGRKCCGHRMAKKDFVALVEKMMEEQKQKKAINQELIEDSQKSIIEGYGGKLPQ